MNEVEYMLMQDNREKKSAGRGIYHKRSGSKTKYCGLPSDHLTPAQWKRRNGPMQTYNISKAITKAEDFYALPRDLATTYLANIQSTYNVSMEQIATSMCVSGKALKRYCTANGIHYADKRGPRIISDTWYQFLAGKANSTGKLLEPVEAPAPEPEAEPIPAPEIVSIPASEEPAAITKVTANKFTLAAKGTPEQLLDLIMVAFADLTTNDTTYVLHINMRGREGDDDE